MNTAIVNGHTFKVRYLEEIEANLVLLKSTRDRCSGAERDENSKCIFYVEQFLTTVKKFQEMNSIDDDCTCENTVNPNAIPCLNCQSKFAEVSTDEVLVF